MGKPKEEEDKMFNSIQAELRERQLNWEKKCMMVIMAPLFAYAMTQRHHSVEGYIEDALNFTFELYDALDCQVTRRLTSGETDGPQ